jgi:hypothetical protein
VRFDLLLCYAVVGVDIIQLLFNAIGIENLINNNVIERISILYQQDTNN